MTRDELIAALEKEPCASRSMDAEIVAAFRIAPKNAPGWWVNWGGDYKADDGIPGRVYLAHSNGRRGGNWEVPRYTASIDAALALVPEGARVRELGQWWDINAPGGWFCSVMRWEYEATGGVVERAYTYGIVGPRDDKIPPTAPNAAIALCIAALRARTAP